MKLFTNILLLFVFCGAAHGQELIFYEDFDSKILNESHWNYELGNGCPNLCGWGNNERQHYTKKNVFINDGNLVIKASKTGRLYESGRITTAAKVEFQYGTIEVRAKLPVGKGIWPAIWMLGNDIDSVGWPACGEIDIMEYVGRQPQILHNSLHTPDSHGNTINTKKTQVDDLEKGFHVYKASWTKDKIDFFIDGRSTYTFSPSEKNEKTWPYNKPFYLILNLAIGGNFGGPEVDDSIFPQEFIIDYIKIFKP